MSSILRSAAIAATGFALLSGSAAPTATTATQLSSVTTTGRSSTAQADEHYKVVKVIVSEITVGISLNLD